MQSNKRTNIDAQNLLRRYASTVKTADNNATVNALATGAGTGAGALAGGNLFPLIDRVAGGNAFQNIGRFADNIVPAGAGTGVAVRNVSLPRGGETTRAATRSAKLLRFLLSTKGQRLLGRSAVGTAGGLGALGLASLLGRSSGGDS